MTEEHDESHTWLEAVAADPFIEADIETGRRYLVMSGGFQGGQRDASAFTAPVSGRYQIEASLKHGTIRVTLLDNDRRN